MNKTLTYNARNNEIVKNENIGEVLLHVNPQTSVPGVADIKDLNKIIVGLFIKRSNKDEQTIFDGGLGDLLEILYAGSTMLEIVKTKLSSGYNFLLDFSKYPFIVSGADEFRISINAGLPSEAFTSAVTAGTTMNLYTNPSTQGNQYGLVPVFRSYVVGANEDLFEKSLGNSVGKIVIVNHPSEDFDTTTNAQPSNVQLNSDQDPEDITITELLARNQRFLMANPSSKVKNLVHYQGTLLNNVKYKCKFDEPCTKDHKILTTQFVRL